MTAPPSPPPAPSRQDVLAGIRGIADQIALARRHLGEGHLVDLSPLEHATRAVCEAVRALPPEEGRSLRPDLEAMLYDLDALETALTDAFGPQARQDRGTSRPRQPTLGAAYRDQAPRGGGLDEES